MPEPAAAASMLGISSLSTATRFAKLTAGAGRPLCSETAFDSVYGTCYTEKNRVMEGTANEEHPLRLPRQYTS